MLAQHGRYVIAVLYAGGKTVPLHPVLPTNRNLQIIGSFFGRADHRHEALSIGSKLHKGVNLSAMCYLVFIWNWISVYVPGLTPRYSTNVSSTASPLVWA
ncbi:hypothetical protein BH09ACT3_BH09ACT3_01090 [soil metagenome]